MQGDWLDERIRRAAAEYHRPPVAPREVMWQAIAAAQQRRRSRRQVVWVAWSAGLAATLALGIGIGHWMDRRPVPPPGPAMFPGSEPALAYRVAAAQYLTRTEALLTGVRLGSGSGNARLDAQLAGQARDLLATTRLMLDSPAARDLRLKGLLEDLELVLAQVAQLAESGDPEDARLITQGLDQRSVLPRLRAAAPAAPLALRTQGAL